MITVSSIGPKIVSSVKKGKINANKLVLAQEINLKNVTKTKAAYAACGGLDTLCSMYNMF